MRGSKGLISTFWNRFLPKFVAQAVFNDNYAHFKIEDFFDDQQHTTILFYAALLTNLRGASFGNR